jgi:hypothetical protein
VNEDSLRVERIPHGIAALSRNDLNTTYENLPNLNTLAILTEEVDALWMQCWRAWGE